MEVQLSNDALIMKMLVEVRHFFAHFIVGSWWISKAGVILLVDLNGSLSSVMIDRNYTAMHTHVRWSVHLSALLIT
jgi:hypothetical protein